MLYQTMQWCPFHQPCMSTTHFVKTFLVFKFRCSFVRVSSTLHQFSEAIPTRKINLPNHNRKARNRYLYSNFFSQAQNNIDASIREIPSFLIIHSTRICGDPTSRRSHLPMRLCSSNINLAIYTMPRELLASVLDKDTD